MTNNTEPCWEPGKILHQILQCFFSLNLQDFDQFFCVVPRSLRLDLAQSFFCLGVSENLRQTQYWLLYFGFEWKTSFCAKENLEAVKGLYLQSFHQFSCFFKDKNYLQSYVRRFCKWFEHYVCMEKVFYFQN